jgi:pimeloyl-ACP methyl ester carboxylesterase
MDDEVLMDDEVPPSATRRVKLHFDKDGDPAYRSVKSPECFKQRALGVLPPRDVIPVIFVPGTAGSNLRLKKGKEETWVPPNGASDGWKALKMAKRTPSDRQRLFDPENVEVFGGGQCTVSDKTYWLDEKEARQRGWGEVHALSYNELLQRLEVSLNDQYSRPGYTEDRGNFLLEEIGMLKYLHAGGPESSITQEDKIADSKRGGIAFGLGDKYVSKPDYAKLAKETIKVWGKAPRALSDKEIARLDDYYYPVWAYGYNWLGDPEIAAEGLTKRIDAILKHYTKGKYFRHQGKVIIITHSMGGLITRRAAQMDSSKILGVVHGVCPLSGAAVIYRRMRAGQEGSLMVAAIMGNTQEKMTVQIGRSPGAFILAPTKDYPPNWLRAYATDKEEAKDLLFSLPKADPYSEIYAKTTDDVWWGMVDPRLLDPMGVMTGYDDTLTPTQAYKIAIGVAEGFHDRLKLYAHPETYGFYGTDNGKYRSFGHVSWLNTSKITWEPGGIMNAEYNTPESRKIFETKGGSTYHLNGEASVTVRNTTTPKRAYEHVIFRLIEQPNVTGDGTVPAYSGEMLKKLTPALKEVLGIPGYEHQSAFDDTYAYQASIYFITRIIQKAAPPPPDKESLSCSAPDS